MSDQQQSVWPDGAREAVLLAIHDNKSLPSRMATDILTALEPFVQQRIAEATKTLDDDCRNLRDTQSWIADAVGLAPYMGCYVAEDVLPAVRRVVAERDLANALAESRRIAEDGARETLNHERAERSQAEQLLADVDADCHRLRAEVARHAAVLRLCAGEVLTCYPTDDGTVKVAVNLNDYFVPASDGEEIAMADAPVLEALYKQEGWPAIHQWVADRRGIPNQHWRERHIDAARSGR